MQIFKIIAHRLIDFSVVALNGGAQHTQISDYACVFVKPQLIIPIELGRLHVIFKDCLGHSDKICNL